MTHGTNPATQLLLPFEDSAAASLGAYSDSDAEDVATRFFETPRPEPSWLVWIAPFDRRSMTRERLLGELRAGQLVHRETPVWRVGMLGWRAIAQVEEFRAALPALAPEPRAPWWRNARRVPDARWWYALLLAAIFPALLLWLAPR